ncbi:hypothetical protein L7F22_055660 [Adiantum nelumboides]|nr:hypothetical protein [Adiantum nelumboides]
MDQSKKMVKAEPSSPISRVDECHDCYNNLLNADDYNADFGSVPFATHSETQQTEDSKPSYYSLLNNENYNANYGNLPFAEHLGIHQQDDPSPSHCADEPFCKANILHTSDQDTDVAFNGEHFKTPNVESTFIQHSETHTQENIHVQSRMHDQDERKPYPLPSAPTMPLLYIVNNVVPSATPLLSPSKLTKVEKDRADDSKLASEDAKENDLCAMLSHQERSGSIAYPMKQADGIDKYFLDKENDSLDMDLSCKQLKQIKYKTYDEELQEYEYTFIVEDSTSASLADVFTYKVKEKEITPKAKGKLHLSSQGELEDAYTQLFDGAYCRQRNKAAGGFVILNEEKKEVLKKSIQLHLAHSNNEAEYATLKAGLEECKSMGIKRLMVKGDALLIVRQMQGTWACKNSKLLQWLHEVKLLMKEF